MAEAQYIAVIAHGTGWTEDYIRWQLPLCRGRAYVHAFRLMEGEAMMWPDRRLSETGRWWDQFLHKSKLTNRKFPRAGHEVADSFNE